MVQTSTHTKRLSKVIGQYNIFIQCIVRTQGLSTSSTFHTTNQWSHLIGQDEEVVLGRAWGTAPNFSGGGILLLALLGLVRLSACLKLNLMNQTAHTMACDVEALWEDENTSQGVIVHALSERSSNPGLNVHFFTKWMLNPFKIDPSLSTISIIQKQSGKMHPTYTLVIQRHVYKFH